MVKKCLRFGAILGLFHLLTGSTAAQIKAEKPTGGDQLVETLYAQNAGGLFWYGGDTAALHSLWGLKESLELYGLRANDYQFPDNAEQPAGDLMPADRAITRSMMDIARDIYCGNDIGEYILNDEISRAYVKQDDSFLVTWFGKWYGRYNLAGGLAALEPADAEYLVLKNELRLQLQLADASKVDALRVAISFRRWIAHFQFARYIVVNIPSATLSYYEGGRKVLTMEVIVGKAATRTPRMATWCNRIILYPYWHVPHSIAVKELLPVFRRNPRKVSEMDMQLLDQAGRVVDPYTLKWSSFSRAYFPYTIRQCTGCDNALGVIKFNLTDPFDVYMHDTNNKIAFLTKKRYYSHGCIRLSRPVEMANYLLDNKVDSSFLKACIKGQKPVTIALQQPVPVFVTYNLAVAGDDSVSYYGDIYGLRKRK